MRKLLLTSSLIVACTFATNSHAGWWDDMFGSEEKAPVKVAAPQQATPTETITKSLTESVKKVASQSLLDMVTSKAGFTSDQATGGLGAIFKTAQGTLNQEDFQSIAQAVPEMDALLAAAPVKKEDNSLVGGLLAGAGKAGELLGLFDQLGLSANQVSSFTTLIQEYFTAEQKPELSEILMKGVANFL